MAIHVLADHIAHQGGGFEPQRQHNWTFHIFGLGGEEDIALSLANGFLPRMINDEVEIPFGNERVWVAGKANWEAGQLIIRDFVDRPVAQALYQWKTQVYDPIAGTIGLAANYKKEGAVILFGPNSTDNSSGTFTRVWTIIGCWPVEVTFASNGLDMRSSDQVMIETRIRYDKATFNPVTGPLVAAA